MATCRWEIDFPVNNSATFSRPPDIIMREITYYVTRRQRFDEQGPHTGTPSPRAFARAERKFRELLTRKLWNIKNTGCANFNELRRLPATSSPREFRSVKVVLDSCYFGDSMDPPRDVSLWRTAVSRLGSLCLISCSTLILGYIRGGGVY